jgi:hypothetical protein
MDSTHWSVTASKLIAIFCKILFLCHIMGECCFFCSGLILNLKLGTTILDCRLPLLFLSKTERGSWLSKLG